jgi:general secretion pathway protein D
MKKILILLIFLKTISSAEMIYTTLSNFVSEVFTERNEQFILDENINTDLLISVNSNKSKFEMLKTILEKYQYYVVRKNDFYYISKTDNSDTVRYITLNYSNFEDIQMILTLYENLKFSYLKESNKIAIKSSKDLFDQIYLTIKQIDTVQKQQKIKVSILETNLGKLKDLQGVINASLPNSQKIAFDLLLGSNFTISNTQSEITNDFKSVLSFLDKNNVSNVLTDTILTLRHNKITTINSSQNIPYLTTSNLIDDIKTNEVNNYDYKDVGLFIKIKPIILDNVLDLNLVFEYSQLLSNTDNKPVTTKKSLNQDIILNRKNKIFVLNGINNYSKTFINERVPLLSDIPLLGHLFQNEKINHSSTTTTIIIELLAADNNYDFKVIDDLKSSFTNIEKEKKEISENELRHKQMMCENLQMCY